MSVLLVEVMADAFPCKLPPVSAFDKQLLVISETTLLPVDLRTEYSQVFTCEEFISARSSQKYFLRTSSELFRGAIAGHLSASCRLSVSSERQDLYTRMFRNVQIYTSPAAIKPTPTASISNAVVLYTPPAQTAITGRSDPEITLEVFNKFCNIYLVSIVKSTKNRRYTEPEAISQIMDVLNGKYVITTPFVANKPKTAKLIFDAFIQAGFFKLEGKTIIYNNAMCNHSKFPATLSMLKPVAEVSSTPKAINSSISVNESLYKSASNTFLNSYLCSTKLRSSMASQVVNELEKIIVKLHGSKETAKSLSQLIFSSFCQSKYYTVSNGIVTYNIELCRGKPLNKLSLPPPVSVIQKEKTQIKPDIRQTAVQHRLNIEESKKQPREAQLSIHISNMIEKVKQSKYLYTETQIMETIQQSLFEYEKEANLALEVKEIVEIVEALYKFLKGQGYKTPK